MLLRTNKLPSYLLPQILLKELVHLDTRNFRDVNLEDLMEKMRTAGVEKLQSFQTDFCQSKLSLKDLTLDQLVPNKQLTVLYMCQLRCNDDSLAALTIEFPLLV